jgi:hypothetical protein
MRLVAIIKRLQKSCLFWNWEVKIAKKTPTIVYQMGKVGSRSVTDSLIENGLYPVAHIHRMNPANIESVKAEYRKHKQKPRNERIGLWCYKNISRNIRQRAKIITLVREPISRNISAFFQNYQRFTGHKYGQSNFQTDQLIKMFVSEYRHEVPLIWFDNEIKQTLGVDVYEHEFPKERGHMEIRKGRIELLVIKTEISDSSKEAAIAKFLDLENFELKRSNIGNQKYYADAYQKFKNEICLPQSYIDQMLTSKYTQHFYSNSELEEIHRKWRV